MRTVTKLWIGLAVLIMLSPLGLILPEYFKAGAAWGEWGAEEIQKMMGYVPKGLEELSSLWNAPMPDYAFKGWEGRPLKDLSLAYVASAVLGITVTIGIVFLMVWNFKKRNSDR